MSISTSRFFLIVSLCLIDSLINAQAVKLKVYVDPQGQRYTQRQFDSIRTANIGKPIAQKDRFEKEKEIEITFEILSIDPFDAFVKKWVGQPLPAFSLKDIKGKVHSNASIRGKLTVINLWSITCGPCLMEIPRLNELVSKYVGKGVVFLAPAPEQLPRIQKALSKRRFTYSVLPQAQELFSSMGIDSYPYHLVLDKTGIIRDIYHGSRVDTKTNQAVLDERLVSAIDDVLKN